MIELSNFSSLPPKSPGNLDLAFARMRCLHQLGEWEKLLKLCRDLWENSKAQRRQIAPMAAAASWNLSQWGQMNEYASAIEESVEGTALFPQRVV